MLSILNAMPIDDGPRGRLLVWVLLLSLTGCITDHGPIQWEKWRSTYPEYYSTPLADKAQTIEKHLLTYHLSPEGVLVYDRKYIPFDPEKPGSYANLSDQTIWTGALAGALAFKYKVTRSPQDRELLIRVLQGVQLLQNVTGSSGLMSRAIFPKGLPIPDEATDGEWRDAPRPYVGYRYRGDVSKDQYFGVLFGYAATTVELGIDAERGDREIHRLLAAPTSDIADHFWNNGCRIVDVDSKVTTHGDLSGYYFGIPIGPNAAMSLGFQLLAHRLTGEKRFKERYDELIAKQYHKATTLIKFEIFGDTNHNNDNMGMMGLYALTNLETDPKVLETYDRNLAKLWGYIKNEGNAFFHLIYASRTELPEFARFDLVENLKLFPPKPQPHPVNLLDHPAVELDFFDDRFDVPKNRTALPMHLRVPGPFIWKSCPFGLVYEVKNPGTQSVPGFDFLLAYWMARARLGEI